jgi:hypothetical protein
VPPANPGATTIIPAGATGIQISSIRHTYSEAKNLFVEYNSTNKALNSLYLQTLNHCITGFANVTTQQMLMHLYSRYGRLTPSNLQENDAQMKQPYNANEPIKTLFQQIKDGIELTDAAGAPYTPSQIVAIAYMLIFDTGMFPEACREGRRRQAAEQTIANFKIDFTVAHQEYRDTQTTSNQAGYHSANNATSAFDI